MPKKYFFLIILALQTNVFAQSLQWPEITNQTKPWTRWWWPGSIVNTQDLTKAMEEYSRAGLGGMEIAVIYGVKGQEDKFINYLSPKWMDMFMHTLREAERLNLGIDLANASGWPFGGPWVEPSDACRNINIKVYQMKEGDLLNEKIEFVQQPLVRAVGQKPDISTLTWPASKNKNLQLYAIDQIRFEKQLPLKILMACSDKGVTHDITDKVAPDGTLNWTAPQGNWTLYALFEGWHGKMSERAGPGGEGDVIDHFSGKAIDSYLRHFDTVFADYDINSLRGYFNDSYEVDDASGQADWTSDLFDEFSLRRGYDLQNFLPALFQKDIPAKNERVLTDYRQTISDLLLDEFTSHWTAWAHRQGKTTRNQSHGSPGNILDLYAASDIPETEGNDILRFRFASSAANVSGKKLVSCEAATWLGEHFSSSLADVKKNADQFFLAGINHLFYHGTCFSPQDEPWPGFLFYAAVEFTPANSFWKDFPALNSYITRVQSFLQNGKPDNNILLYFPISDLYAKSGNGMLRHFDAPGPDYDNMLFKKGAAMMQEKGYSFDYISDLAVCNTETNEHYLFTEGNNYKTLVVPGCKYIPLETFSQILNLANEGAHIIIYGYLPENVAGFGDLQKKTEALSEMKSELLFLPAGKEGIMQASVGKGSVILGDNLDALLDFRNIERETMTDSLIGFTRRKTDNGYSYFIVNQGDKQFNGWLPLSIVSQSAAIFNPVSGKNGLAVTKNTGNSKTLVYTMLEPGESLIITPFNKKIKARNYTYYNKVTSPVPIDGTWKLRFISGGPVLPAESVMHETKAWTILDGEDVKNFSGTADYSVTFNKPESKADAWLLDLGRVCESARVTLNGKEVAVLVSPPFNVTIEDKNLMPVNNLVVTVSNLMANRIAWLDKNGVPWKKFYNINFAARLKENTKNGIFDASAWSPRESGLPGPVTITPLKKLLR